MAQRELELLREVEHAGGGHRLGAYAKLSGPGWLQSALKLGASSMSASLYLGVLGGYSLLWLQPIAMLLGVIMLSAIGYVTMSTGKRPFQAVNEYVSPVLGWGWALGALLASIVWAAPQYSLAIGVLQQNLAPSLLGAGSPLSEFQSKLLISTSLLVICGTVLWGYGGGGKGLKVFDWILKVMVMMIVACFFGVVFRLAFAPGGLDWMAVLRGFIPDPRLFFRPAAGFLPLIDAVEAPYRSYWYDLIVSRQRDVLVASAAASAGINGTFLFAYTLLRRGWGREFRGFCKFDLLTSMFIPFALATSCVVVAAAHQFHTVPQAGFLDQGAPVAGATAPSARQQTEYRELLQGRLEVDSGSGAAGLPAAELQARLAALGDADRRLAATLVTRDAFGLAASIQPFTGPIFANVVFGFGVLGMCISTITLLMLICGLVTCEILGRPHSGWPLRMGAVIAGIGALGPFLWNKAYFWLAVPTSVFASILIPIAYITFFLLMNQPRLLGIDLPRGRRRVAWNTLMSLAIGAFTISAGYMILEKAGPIGLVAGGVFIAAAILTRRKGPPADPPPSVTASAEPFVSRPEHRSNP
jgi:Mn2+/Fe2+ NRAMP family transporter